MRTSNSITLTRTAFVGVAAFILTVAMAVCISGCKDNSRKTEWANGLGIEFVKVPGTQSSVSVRQVRQQDYHAFSRATGKEWITFRTDPFAPAFDISWNEAIEFCEWLTQMDRKLGNIGPGQHYRLPTGDEWTVANHADLFEPSPQRDTAFKIEWEWTGDFDESTSGTSRVVLGAQWGLATNSPPQIWRKAEPPEKRSVIAFRLVLDRKTDSAATDGNAWSNAIAMATDAVQRKDWSMASEAFDRALKIKPNDPYVISQLQGEHGFILKPAGSTLRVFQPHNDKIKGLKFASADRVISWENGGRTRIWSLTNGELLQSFVVSNMVRFTVSRDAKYAVSAQWFHDEESRQSSEICLWDLQKGVPVRTITKASTPDAEIGISSDGRYVLVLFSNGNSFEIQQWNSDGWQLKQRFKGASEFSSPEISAAFSPDGRHALISAEERSASGLMTGNSQFFVWDIEAGELVTKTGIKNEWPSRISASHDGRFFLICKWFSPEDGSSGISTKVEILDVEDRSLIQIFANANSIAEGAWFSPDDRYALILLWEENHKYTLLLIEIETRKVVRTIPHQSKDSISSNIEMSPDGRYLLSARDRDVILWKLWDWDEVR